MISLSWWEIGIGEIVSNFINFGLEISNVIDNEQLTENQASDDNETEPNFLVQYGPLTKQVSELIDGIMGDLSPEVTSEDKKEIDAMLRRNFMAFQTYPELGCTNKAIHRIDTSDSAPVQQRYWRIPLHKCPVVEAEVKRMLDQGVIEPAQSPWSSNIVLEWKPRSKKWRVCSDFRWISFFDEEGRLSPTQARWDTWNARRCRVLRISGSRPWVLAGPYSPWW